MLMVMLENFGDLFPPKETNKTILIFMISWASTKIKLLKKFKNTQEKKETQSVKI